MEHDPIPNELDNALSELIPAVTACGSPPSRAYLDLSVFEKLVEAAPGWKSLTKDAKGRRVLDQRVAGEVEVAFRHCMHEAAVAMAENRRTGAGRGGEGGRGKGGKKKRGSVATSPSEVRVQFSLFSLLFRVFIRELLERNWMNETATDGRNVTLSALRLAIWGAHRFSGKTLMYE